MTEEERSKVLGIQDTFDLINIAISTSKIQKLITPFASIRPSLHLILAGRIGSMKSSILAQVCDKLKIVPTFNLTSASIMGTIDKDSSQLITPAIWDARGSVLPIDEFHIDDHNYSQMNSLRSMLIALENMPIQKKIAIRANELKLKDKDNYLIVKNGSIIIKARFVLVANTMQPIYRKQRMIEMEALKTRCLVIPYYPTIDEMLSLSRKKIFYEYKPYKVKPIVKISNEVYDFIEDLVVSKKVSPENLMRTIGDLCRIYAVVGNNNALFNMIIDMRNYKHYD